jgi:hypothetical protein
MAIPLILGLFLVGFRPGILFILVYLSFLLLTALVLTLSRGGVDRFPPQPFLYGPCPVNQRSF